MQNIKLVYTEFIFIWLCTKLLDYRNNLKFVPETKQYSAISVKFLAQRNSGLNPGLFKSLWSASSWNQPVLVSYEESWSWPVFGSNT